MRFIKLGNIVFNATSGRKGTARSIGKAKQWNAHRRVWRFYTVNP